jgi:hypothetical protein
LTTTVAVSCDRLYLPPILIMIVLGLAVIPRQVQVEQGCHTYRVPVTEVFPMDFMEFAIIDMFFLAAPVAVQQMKAKTPPLL